MATVLCGDAIEMLRTLPSESVDAVVTDPPYNIGVAKWDSWPTVDAFLEWYRSWTDEARRVLKPTGSLVVFASQLYAAHIDLLLQEAWNILNRCVWTYENGQRQASRRYSMGYDPFFWAAKGDDWLFDEGEARDGIMWRDPRPRPKRHANGHVTMSAPHPRGRKGIDVFDCPRITGNKIERADHPSPKPIDLMKRIVAPIVPVGGLVADPFMGSGSTLIAAQQIGREAWGCDREPRYVEMARKRLHGNQLQMVGL